MLCGAYVCNLSQQRMLYEDTHVISHDNECCMWHMHVCNGMYVCMHVCNGMYGMYVVVDREVLSFRLLAGY